MKTLLITAVSAAALAALAPAAASAQTTAAPSFTSPSLYGTLGYDDVDMSHQNLGALQGRLGARFSQYFGVEGEYSYGVKGDKIGVAGAPDVKVQQNSQEAIYGVGFLPINPNFDLLARVGYGHTAGTGSVPGVTPGVRGDSWNYGVGGQYMFDGKNGVRLDYTRESFQPRGSDDANVWAVSYVRKF
ncbi:porin family protein [Phenylobacterium sp.]|jgi:opacity protein-like surface antigen|uniref:porin family protein n=1 Tax=Phenylobacterium sp. TaxID=1871053 RepID=UPI002F3F4587